MEYEIRLGVGEVSQGPHQRSSDLSAKLNSVKWEGLLVDPEEYLIYIPMLIEEMVIWGPYIGRSFSRAVRKKQSTNLPNISKAAYP